MSPGRRAQTLACLGFLVLLPLMVFPQVLAGKTFLFSDVNMAFYPKRWMLHQMGQSGHLFFWNPYIFGGQPLEGSIQEALFYPGNLPAYWMAPNVALSLYLIAHVALGAVLMWLYLREIGHCRAVATCGAVAFSLSGFFIANLGRPPTVAVGIWLPGLLLMIEKYARDPAPRYVALAAFFSGMQLLAGFPQVSMYLEVLVVLYALLRMRGAAHRSPVGFLGGIVVVPGILGLLLAAVALVPFVQVTAFNPRLHVHGEISGVISGEARHFLAWIVPRSETGSLVTGYHYYIGCVTLGLALLALLRPNPRVLFLWTAAALFLLLGLGDQGPLGWVLAHLPLFNRFREPLRLLFVTSSCLSILAADGLATVVNALPSRQTGTVVALVALGALLVDLGGEAQRRVVLANDTFFHQAPSIFTAVSNEVPPPRYLSTPGTQTMFVDIGPVVGAQNIVGYDSSPLYDTIRYLFWSQSGGPPTDDALKQAMYFSYALPITNVDNAMIRLLGLRIVLHPQADGVSSSLVNNPLPRAFLVAHWRIVPHEDQFGVLAHDASFDPRHEVLLERAPGVEMAAAAPAADVGTVRYVRYTPDTIELQTDADQPTVLFLSEIWFFGWTCTVDGQPAPVLRADAVFRAVALPAGHHAVALQYHARGVVIGGVISLLAMLMIGGLLAVDRRRPALKQEIHASRNKRISRGVDSENAAPTSESRIGLIVDVPIEP